MGCCLVFSRMEPTVQRIGVHTRIDVGQGCSVFSTVYSEKGIDSGSRSFAIARLYASGHSFSVPTLYIMVSIRPTNRQRALSGGWFYLRVKVPEFGGITGALHSCCFVWME
jgi:hypothetical protein